MENSKTKKIEKKKKRSVGDVGAKQSNQAKIEAEKQEKQAMRRLAERMKQQAAERSRVLPQYERYLVFLKKFSFFFSFCFFLKKTFNEKFYIFLFKLLFFSSKQINNTKDQWMQL